MAAPAGNNNAAKSKLFHDAIRKASIQEDHARLRQMADALLTKAAEGDIAASMLIRDTLDGKPKQQVEVSGEDGGPVAMSLAVSFKRPDAD